MTHKVYAKLNVTSKDIAELFLMFNIAEHAIQGAINSLKHTHTVKEIITGDSYQSCTSFLVDDLNEWEIAQLKNTFNVYDRITHPWEFVLTQ